MAKFLNDTSASLNYFKPLLAAPASSYSITVDASGTPKQNAAAFLAAYAQAKSQSVSLGLTATKRFTILLPPGEYDFGNPYPNEIHELNLDTSFIDISSTNGEASVYFRNVFYFNYASHTRHTGIHVVYFSMSGRSDDCVFVNCVSGEDSFVSHPVEGTFINCVGGNHSFGAETGIETSALLVNCVASGSYSFGGFEPIKGTLINCRKESGSFSLPIEGGRLFNCIEGNNKIVNYYPSAPLSYAALLTQSSGAPSASVKDNSMGSFVYARSSAGVYTGTLSGAFVGTTYAVNQGVFLLNEDSQYQYKLKVSVINANVIQFETYRTPFADMTSKTYLDGLLTTPYVFEVTIYPGS